MIDPAELVYWRRRAIAVASILGLVLVVIWAVSGPSQPAPTQTGGETNTAGSTQLSFAPPAPPAPAGETVAAPSKQPAPSQASMPGGGLPSGLASGSDLPGGGLPPSSQPGAAQPGSGLPGAGLPNAPGSAPPAGLAGPQTAPGAGALSDNPGLTSSGLPAGRAPGAAPGAGGLPGSTPAGSTRSGSTLSTSSAPPPNGSAQSTLPGQDGQPPSGSVRSSHSRPGTQVRPDSAATSTSGGDLAQGQSRLGAQAAGPPTVVPPAPLGSDDPNADPGDGSGSGGSGGLPGVATAPRGTATPGHAGRPGAAAVPVVAKCSDQDLALVSQVAAASYKVGQKPLFRLVIANIGDKPCSRDLDPGLQGLVINGPAGQLWASNDCDAGHKPDVRVLDPGKPMVFSLNWAGRTSHPGCGGTRTTVGPGTYQLIGKLGPLSSGPAPFTLTGGEPGARAQVRRPSAPAQAR
ncbi:MAG TPA: hypothetical protein VH008_31515 [Pseudonocardia sp.]|jgi:hypothetical protein|nr:hypothetical protein [Pseudonocardia sp.]